MAQPNLPPALLSASWEKHKAALAKVAKPPVTKLGDELKLLARAHAAVEWGGFGADKLDSVEKARAGIDELDSAVKGGKIKALVAQVDAVEASAAKFETDAKKDKAFPKEPLAAATLIVKASKELRADIGAFVDAARKALAAKAQALAAARPKAGGAAAPAGAESKSAKIVRSRVLDAIRKMKKPAPGAKPIRFIVVQGKAQVASYLAVSVGPAQEKLLKGLLPGEAPYKVIKDPQAQVVWEKNAITFVSDRVAGGLVKKMQLWLKKILKLNLKLRVRKTNGEVEESEGEDIPDDLLKEDPAEAAARIAEGKDFQQRLATLQPRIREAMSGPAGAELKELIDELTAHGNGGDYAAAAADLDEIEALLDEPGDAGEAAAGATAPAATGAAAPASGAAPAAADAMELWKTRRGAAVTTLKAVAAKIAGAKHASSAKAILEIQAVTKNLTAEPATLQQVTELQTWLGSDDVVNDVCELAEDIRTPLLGALEQLRARYAA